LRGALATRLLDDSEEQENENDGQQKTDAASAVVPPARASAITSIPESEDKYKQDND
jgi:hypothetical protein